MDQGDICAFQCHIGPRTHRDANLRLRECRCIVDTITNVFQESKNNWAECNRAALARQYVLQKARAGLTAPLPGVFNPSVLGTIVQRSPFAPS